ncbi:MAG: DUF456 domain-containing protein [Bacteroidota bacterium]|nr:DUF456 domain-containing protein [Bacteroidota bacterium]MDX5428382.1 DUF456 domain-containing protein [Bacteroidota bacterium]MDX5447898.1 DUF456 domain-containing protein [Bacteroidota bacterium]MDX5506152.1 DUF456 domain-containing protein [Bacteroidota bacterium]
MDYFLIILGFSLLLLGLAGAILPILPGPPLSFVGLLLIEISFGSPSPIMLYILGALALLVFLLDYWVPIWGTRKFGGTRAGVIGATLGLIAGLLVFPPFGVILGPFAGAYIGEVIYSKKTHGEAFKAAWGSFIGFLLGTGIKLIYSFLTLYLAITHILKNT